MSDRSARAVMPLCASALPLHPRPRACESLTGFLTRTLEENRVKTMAEFRALAFPAADARRVPRDLELPAGDAESLGGALACPAARLVAATFYHLARAFGRASSGARIGRFLTGSLDGHLRFCPACLAERGHRSLLWRVSALPGCPEHNCRLLGACGHCGRAIPPLAAPFRVAGCPHCHGDLRACRVEHLADEEREWAARRGEDLAHLLRLAPTVPPDASWAGAIGWGLRRLRREQRLGGWDLAERLGVAPAEIKAIEHARAAAGRHLHVYQSYAEALGTTLSRLVLDPAPRRTLEDAAREAIRSLVDAGIRVTARRVADAVGCTPQAFCRYPAVMDLISQKRAEWRSSRPASREQQRVAAAAS